MPRVFKIIHGRRFITFQTSFKLKKHMKKCLEKYFLILPLNETKF